MTEPIDMKNPKVAAELSIYCDRVPITPLGPGPALRDCQITVKAILCAHLMIENPPNMNPIVNPTVEPINAPI